jgi:hypothetical protein
MSPCRAPCPEKILKTRVLLGPPAQLPVCDALVTINMRDIHVNAGEEILFIEITFIFFTSL